MVRNPIFHVQTSSEKMRFLGLSSLQAAPKLYILFLNLTQAPLHDFQGSQRLPMFGLREETKFYSSNVLFESF
jgi:hypothetical protein